MKENIYNKKIFFEKYSQMDRSLKGLDGAGEWHQFKKMLPNFKSKRVLDLGCGYGWHCIYAIEKGAESVTGVDISEKMIEMAKTKTSELDMNFKNIKYINMPIEDINFPDKSFDIVISSLTFHYIKSFENICKKVFKMLDEEGEFVFSVEHPVFTAYGTQDWFRDENGNVLHWPVDNYYNEGIREAVFLGEVVKKYHKTMTTYINQLLKAGFILQSMEEAMPNPEMIGKVEGMENELRRPMMLLISAKKPNL